VEEREMNLKVLPFNHSFKYQDRILIVAAKGLFQWQMKGQ
jgi:hypothetical protein